jgi:SMC interacting uncharacterized protein involved in chromosome segregation
VIAQLVDQGVLSLAAAIVLAVLGTGGVIAWLKVRPEAAKLAVDTAEGAVTVQSKVLADVYLELDREKRARQQLEERLDELIRTSADVDTLNERIVQLESERVVLTAAANDLQAQVARSQTENVELRGRVAALEDELAHIR